MHNNNNKHGFEKRRPNHHSSRPNRRQASTAEIAAEGEVLLSRATTTVARGARNRNTRTRGGRNRSRTTAATRAADVPTQTASPADPTTTTQPQAPPPSDTLTQSLQQSSVNPTVRAKLVLPSTATTLLVSGSSALSTSSSNPSSASAALSALVPSSSSTQESSTAASQTSSKPPLVPAFLASLGVVALLGIIIWLCRRKRRQAKTQRDALTSLAPDPYYIEKEGYDQSDDTMEEVLREKHGSDNSAQPQYAGRPKSFLDSLRWTLLGKKSIRRQQQAELEAAQNAAYSDQMRARAESPPVPRMPGPNQLANHPLDPFSAGFVGADVLATGLSNNNLHSHTSRPSQSSIDSSVTAQVMKFDIQPVATTPPSNNHPRASVLSNPSTMMDQPYSQPNVRQLYSGLQRTNSEFSATSSEESREEEAFVYALSGDDRSQSMGGQSLAYGTDGRSIHYGTIRSVSTASPVAWRRV